MPEDRLPVFPTRMVLNDLKQRLASARSGYSLLKRKADALTLRFRELMRLLRDAKRTMGQVMSAAYLSLAQARLVAGDEFAITLRESIGACASFRVHASEDSVAGVVLPKFVCADPEDGTGVDLPGLGRGGQLIVRARDMFRQAAEHLVKIASLQASYRELDSAIKLTNRRVNALEHVIIPRLRNTVRYVKTFLEESAREETFKLKKVQAKKVVAKAKQNEEEAALKKQQQADTPDSSDDTSSSDGSTNLSGSAAGTGAFGTYATEDPDVVV